jgi:hypothetical protein
MTQPFTSATPVKKIMPTVIAPQHSATNVANRADASCVPATSISRLPRTISTKPAAIAMWMGPHHGVLARTDGRSSKPPAGTG